MHGQPRALTHEVLRQATIERSLRGGNYGFEGKKMHSNVSSYLFLTRLRMFL